MENRGVQKAVDSFGHVARRPYCPAGIESIFTLILEEPTPASLAEASRNRPASGRHESRPVPETG